jgi:hypothetical protein
MTMSGLRRHEFRTTEEDNMSRSAVTACSDAPSHLHAAAEEPASYQDIIDDICGLPWEQLRGQEILQVAHAYYYFSVQFRENLEIARQLYPSDPNLQQLHREECDTDNLSPWPHVARPGEKLNHDEFMRRLLALQPIDGFGRVTAEGAKYLAFTRRFDAVSRALSIVSYEDGGLSRIFGAILRAPDWTGQGQQAFRHFLEKHLVFDSDPTEGHGALCRHFTPDNRVTPLWQAFKNILVVSAPTLLAEGGFLPADARRERAVRDELSPAIVA